MVSPACEECCFCLFHVELEIPPASSFDALRCAGFEFHDHLDPVPTGCHPPEVLHKRDAVDTFDYLFDPLYQHSGSVPKRPGRAALSGGF